MLVIRLLAIICLLFFPGHNAIAQNPKVNWITFSQLNDSLHIRPKKVFVDFYADWCGVCKQMEKKSFTNENVIAVLNRDYYAVKMNIESIENVQFGGITYSNKRRKKINPIHDIALLMASRKDAPFSLPAIVLLDENFVATARYFQYLDAEALLKILNDQ